MQQAAAKPGHILKDQIMQTITATDSMNRAYRAHTDPRKPATFAKPGETQAAAIKRLMSAHKRAWTWVEKRNYPAYKPGMSTAEYVRGFEAMNSGNGQKTADFWQALNTEPATLYAGESFDFAPIVEDCADDEPMLAEPIEAPAVEPKPEPDPVAPIVAADHCPPIGEMAQDVDPIAWQIRAARPTTIYATPAYRIGVHEWCMVVYAHDIYAACTDHLWRRVDANAGRFFTQREWPTYNSNDGTYGGLPKSIRGKVFDPNEAQIDRALADARAGILPAWAGGNIRSTLQQGIDARARQDESLQILREQREMVARVKAKAAAAARPDPIAAESAHVEPEPVACTPSPAVVEMRNEVPAPDAAIAFTLAAEQLHGPASAIEAPGARQAALPILARQWALGGIRRQRRAFPPTWRGADALRRPAARCGMAPAPPPAWGKCAPTANCNIERRAS